MGYSHGERVNRHFRLLCAMSQKGEKAEPTAVKDVFKSKTPGWATMQSTSAFRAINFELFVRPVSSNGWFADLCILLQLQTYTHR